MFNIKGLFVGLKLKKNPNGIARFDGLNLFSEKTPTRLKEKM
jgi:hypothetical protein